MQTQKQVVNMIGLAITASGKDGQWTIWNTVEDELGLQKLGYGCYGAVFRHPSNYDLVIKVGTDMDDGWLDYAAFCMQNYHGNPELLVVHDIRVFESCWVAVIERLDSPNGRTNYAWHGEVEGSHSKLLDQWRNGEELPLGAQLLWNTLGDFNDLHNENVMFREDQMVITDPYCSHKGHYTKFKTANGRIDVTVNSIYNVSDDKLLEELNAGPNGAPMVAVGKAATVRAQEEDTVLRAGPLHDNPALYQGIQRALLPVLRPRRVPSAWNLKSFRDNGPLGGYRQLAEWAGGIALGRDPGSKGEVPVAATGRHRFFPRIRIPYRIQPKLEPDDPSNLQPVGIKWHYREVDIRRKA